MYHMRTVPAVLALAIVLLTAIVLWGVRRERVPQVGLRAQDDRAGKMLLWLLILAALAAGAFFSSALIRP